MSVLFFDIAELLLTWHNYKSVYLSLEDFVFKNTIWSFNATMNLYLLLFGRSSFFFWQSENISNNDFWFKMDEQHNDQKKSVKRQTTMGKTLHSQINFNQQELHQTQDVKSGESR
jgi:hypothetical protein